MPDTSMPIDATRTPPVLLEIAGFLRIIETGLLPPSQAMAQAADLSVKLGEYLARPDVAGTEPEPSEPAARA